MRSNLKTIFGFILFFYFNFVNCEDENITTTLAKSTSAVSESLASELPASESTASETSAGSETTASTSEAISPNASSVSPEAVFRASDTTTGTNSLLTTKTTNLVENSTSKAPVDSVASVLDKTNGSIPTTKYQRKRSRTGVTKALKKIVRANKPIKKHDPKVKLTTKSSALRYGFQRSECPDYEKTFLCARKCLDYGFDGSFADKECQCRCYKIKEKAKYTSPRHKNSTKYKLGAPTTSMPVWAQPMTEEAEHKSEDEHGESVEAHQGSHQEDGEEHADGEGAAENEGDGNAENDVNDNNPDDADAANAEAANAEEPNAEAPNPDAEAPNPDAETPSPDAEAPNPDGEAPNPDGEAPNPEAEAPNADPPPEE